MKSAIKGIASKGRNGDNMLVHMAPDEVAGIASLGGVSINPETGLPEMFKFRDFLKIAVPVGIAMATGNPAIAAKMPSFLTNPIGRAVISGATSALSAKLGGGDSGEVKRAFGTGVLADAALQGGQKMFGDPAKAQQLQDIRAREVNRQQALQKNMEIKPVTNNIVSNDPVGYRTPKPTPITSDPSIASYDPTGYRGPQASKLTPAEELKLVRGDMMMRGVGPAVGLLSSGALDPEEERRKRKEIDMVAPYSVQARYPGAGYGSREFSYFNPNSMYAKEGGYIKNMQEGGMVDDAPMLAPPPSPSELGLGEPAPMDNTMGIASTIPAEVATTTREDIVPSSAFQGDIMQYAPGILGASNYDYRSFLPQGDTSGISTPMPTYIGEQITGDPNIVNRGIQQDIKEEEAKKAAIPRYIRQRVHGNAGVAGQYKMVPNPYFTGYNEGGTVGIVSGMGDGMSDSIYGNMTNDPNQQVALSDGEFVIPADVVSGIGNGSTDAGARQLYAMMDEVRNARTGRREQAPEINAEEFLPA